MLRFAIAKAGFSNCTLSASQGVTYTQVNDDFNLETGDLSGTCKVTLKLGGTNKNVGLDKVKVGPISNLVSYSNHRTTYQNSSVIQERTIQNNLPSLAFEGPLMLGGVNAFRKVTSFTETVKF